MAESKAVYGLTSRAAKLLKQMVDKHRLQLPATGRRARRLGGTSAR